VSAAADTQRIGWIGLGKMGLPICERLAAQSFKVTALTRNQEVVTELPARTFTETGQFAALLTARKSSRRRSPTTQR
jgi:3-hydroxyisobutyrate dehydrogenase-like beta-hydroxyacid dehydrogenase